MAKPYRRKVSTEEAREGYLLVTKDRLSFFPPPGTHFRLRVKERSRDVRVESYHCACRGPDKLHEHWFLRWPTLAAGDLVEITADGSRYVATVADGARGGQSVA